MNKQRLLCIDMAYTMKMVNERKLEQEFNSRECGGYFEHVWGVHPMANVPEGKEPSYNGFKVNVFQFSKNQTIIEGSSAYYKAFKNVFPINFLLSQIAFTRYLIRLVKKENIGIIIVTDPYFSGILGLFVKFFTKAKLVVWVVAHYDEIYQATGNPAMPRLFRKRWVEKIIERIVFKSVDLTAGGAKSVQEYVLKNGATLNKFTVFPIGKLIHPLHKVDPQLRAKEEVTTQISAKYIFVYVGRMLDIKFPDDVVKAFEVICRTSSDCALIMAGDGPMLKELKVVVAELGIAQNVHFIGNIDQTKLANIMSDCFAVLSPLTGRSLVEASLAALPIIAYDRDWQLDFVTKSGNGVVVPFRDWESMGKVALALIANPTQTLKYAAASRQAGLDFVDTNEIYAHEQREFKKLLEAK